jgi:hypothetical protein
VVKLPQPLNMRQKAAKIKKMLKEWFDLIIGNQSTTRMGLWTVTPGFQLDVVHGITSLPGADREPWTIVNTEMATGRNFIVTPSFRFVLEQNNS